MEWEGREESSNVEDRRGMNKTAGLAVGGGLGVVIVILGLLFGFDPQKLLEIVNQGQGQNQVEQGPQGQAPADPAEERSAQFSKVIFHDTEVVWGDLFKKMHKKYQEPVLVLFTGKVESACGLADTAVGPFYCPGDSKVYIDLSFYNDMERKLNAPGEFARAYVIAHEVGHHVQHLLGYSQRAEQLRRSGGKTAEHQSSVRLELQADYFAGVWAHYGQETFRFLQPGDMESALNAAFEIGDDRLQKKARGYVVPDTFTHGTSAQRMRWFRKGFDTGDVAGASQLFELRYEQL